MLSLNERHERRLLWLLALTQFTIIMDFMVMMPLGPQIMHAFEISPDMGTIAGSQRSIRYPVCTYGSVRLQQDLISSTGTEQNARVTCRISAG